MCFAQTCKTYVLKQVWACPVDVACSIYSAAGGLNGFNVLSSQRTVQAELVHSPLQPPWYVFPSQRQATSALWAWLSRNAAEKKSLLSSSFFLPWILFVFIGTLNLFRVKPFKLGPQLEWPIWSKNGTIIGRYHLAKPCFLSTDTDTNVSANSEPAGLALSIDDNNPNQIYMQAEAMSVSLKFPYGRPNGRNKEVSMCRCDWRHRIRN